MKRILLALSFVSTVYCEAVFSDYANHAFVDMNVEQSKCIQAGIRAAKTIGFNDARVLEDVIVYGMDKEGNTLQFTCVARKGASYYIVNGPDPNKRGSLSESFNAEVKKALRKIESSY
jgi:hypothetical protein